MGSSLCFRVAEWLYQSSKDLSYKLTREYGMSFYDFCHETQISETESMYSKPMVLIGIYISITSLFCILAMALDLLNGFRSRKFWFPSKYFSLNAASITVITVAMKLPVDLSSPMRGTMDQLAKIGSLAFMCIMMSNFMPSLAFMDNKSLLANVAGLSIFVITLTVNIFIQVRTYLLYSDFYELHMPWSMVRLAYMYTSMLLFLLVISISSAITIPSSKKVLEFKYQAALNDKFTQENQTPTLEELRRLVKRYWIMAETSSPQFAMSSSPLLSASDIICAVSMVMYISLAWEYFIGYKEHTYGSVYKWSMIAIVITQSVGVIVGAIAPICRCITFSCFKLLANENKKHFMVFKVETYWTQKLHEWKESDISFLSSGDRSRALVYILKTCFLSCCIVFQKVIVISCKLIGLIPIVVLILVVYCSCYFKSVKATLFTPLTTSSSHDTSEDLKNGTSEDLHNYVLLLEDNTQLAETTIERISNSMNHLIQNAERKRHSNLLKLVESSVAFNGVKTFDMDQVQSLLSIEPVNSWSLPIVNLTCIAIALPDIHKDKVENLFKSVAEGLLYTHLVEKTLNKASEYVKIRRATIAVWREVEYSRKWLDSPLKRSAYKGKTPIEVIKSFARKAEEIVTNVNKGRNGEVAEKKSLPSKVIIANSMYRIAETIMYTYESNKLDIVDDELFTRLSNMIADILAACLTNIPRVIIKRCYESATEKREASVMAAVDLLGRTTEMIKRLETLDLPNLNPDKMEYIDEWRLHLNQP